MSYLQSAVKVATEAGIGYVLGYAGLVANPMAGALLAGSIAVVKEVTKRFFASDWNLFDPKDDNKRLKGAFKLGLDTACGTALAVVIGNHLLGIRFASVPNVQLIAFSILVEYSRNLFVSAFNAAQPYISQLKTS